MRIGTFCYATSRGLGHLAHDFYLHGVITDPLVIRHPGVPTNDAWYPNAPSTPLWRLDTDMLSGFVKGLDAMLFFETPFWWPIIDHCKSLGVRTYLVVMYECSLTHHAKPHKYLCPSLLDMEYFPSGTFLPLPVSYPWRERGKAHTYIHNGGYLGMRGREGTTLLIEAMRYVESPLHLIIRCQENVKEPYLSMAKCHPRISYQPETVAYEDLYREGEIVVAPQKFNGCSLPLQEAFASGMLVMTTNRFPMNTWLPNEPLIPVKGYQKAQIGGAYLEFDEAQINPRAIAATMDAWYGRDVSEFSRRGQRWAQEHSWESLKPVWMEALSC